MKLRPGVKEYREELISEKSMLLRTHFYLIAHRLSDEYWQVHVALRWSTISVITINQWSIMISLGRLLFIFVKIFPTA